MKQVIPNEKWSVGSEKNCDDVREFLQEQEEKLQRKKAQELAILLSRHNRETIE